MDAMVMSVVSVVFNQTKSLPPILLLHAKGTVPTGGWTNGRLSPHVYLSPPKDGIWDFSFIATMPTGHAIQVVSGVESEVLALSKPEWCKGVRVHASSNAIEASTVTAEFVPENLVSMSWVPYPWGTPGGVIGSKDSDAVARGGIDLFPWALNSPTEDIVASMEDKGLLVRDLIGRSVRVYRQGEMVTMDYVPDRVNIVKSRFGETIENIKLG